MLKGRYNVKVASWDVPVKLAAQVMFRLKFFEAFMNMSRSRFGWGDRTHAENMKPPSPLHIYMFSHIIEMCSREGWTKKTRPLCFTVNAEEAFFFVSPPKTSSQLYKQLLCCRREHICSVNGSWISKNKRLDKSQRWKVQYSCKTLIGSDGSLFELRRNGCLHTDWNASLVNNHRNRFNGDE